MSAAGSHRHIQKDGFLAFLTFQISKFSDPKISPILDVNASRFDFHTISYALCIGFHIPTLKHLNFPSTPLNVNFVQIFDFLKEITHLRHFFENIVNNFHNTVFHSLFRNTYYFTN